MAVKKLLAHLYLACISFLFLKLSDGERHGVYNEYYLDDICFSGRSGEFVLESTGPEAAVKIMSAAPSPQFRHQHCLLSVEPPPFHGLILQLRNGYSPSLVSHHCENYIEIFSEGEFYEKFCNFSTETGVERIFSAEKKVEILVSIEHARKHAHVSMLFTAYDKKLYTCTPDKFQCANSFCLWKGFICDGENNCGDYSDEQEQGMSKCGT